MGRPATGSPRWNPTKKVWEARISITGQKNRKHVAMKHVPACKVAPASPPPKCPCTSCLLAKEVAQIVSDKARREGRVPEETAETANEWHERYLKLHGSFGNETRGMGQWLRWCEPLGTTPMAELRRDQVVAVRDAITVAVHRDEISPKRAANLWSELIKAPFSRAFSDDDPKYSTVRVGPANANPATGIKPPVSTKEKQEAAKERQCMMPRTFLLLMQHAPVEWARLYAVMAFLYVRPEELYALRWSDVDWDGHEIRVRRSMDLKSGEEKSTKTKAGRREVPIHPNLMPLLMQMRAEAGGTEAKDKRIVPLATAVRDVEKIPTMLRRHIEATALASGIDLDELVKGSEELMAFDARSWRTTGCSWHAMLGTDSYALARWAGHESPDITWGHYAKQGPDLRRRHGEPFPPLPERLLDPPRGFGGVSVFWSGNPEDSRGFQCEGGDLNPAPVGPETSAESAPELDKPAPSSPQPPTTDPTVSAGSDPPKDAELNPFNLAEDAVMVALASALGEAAKAGRFDVVAQLARQLEERQHAQAGVARLDEARERRRSRGQ